jgi:hypothetical protein
MNQPLQPTDDDSKYWEIIRAMTPTQKIEAFLSLYWTARELKAAGIRATHPELSETEVQKQVKEAFLYASD